MHPEEINTLGGYWDVGDLATRAQPLALPCDIAPGFMVFHTPGHTRGSISVIVTGRFGDAEGAVVCAGDALPTRDNYIFRLPPGINYDRALASRSMDRIIAKADWIIPGHDGPIRVSKSV
jgi:N-acyl homoserine lactone hydrolase